MRVWVRCTCGNWMVRHYTLMAGPLFMCNPCWDAYWQALAEGPE